MDVDQTMRQRAFELAQLDAQSEGVYIIDIAIANQYYQFMKSGTVPKEDEPAN